MSFEQPKFEERPEIKTDKAEQQGEKIMEMPEIVIGPEKGINLMSFMLKGYNPEWGDNDHELSKATNEYFENNPLSDELRKSLDGLRALKKDGIDQEVLFNIALSYGHPERLRETSANLIRDKELDNPDEVQEKLLKLMEDLNKELSSNPEFPELKNKFDTETKKDIETREEGLERRKKEIDKLLGFFRPKAETTRAKKINIIPTDYLYNKESGMSFGIGDEIIIRAPLKDSENGQWTHEFLHGVINPINDKLYEKLTDEQKEKIVQMSPGKLKQHYGENPGTLLNESFIRTYVNLFDKGSGPYNYEYFKKLIPGVSEKQFQDLVKYDKELKQRMDALGVSNLKEFSGKSEKYFEKYEKNPLGNIIYGFYEDYQKELQNNKKLTFEDFVSSRFIHYLESAKKEKKIGELESSEDPKRFLEFEKLTQSSDDIRKLVEKFSSGRELQRVENILSFLGEKDNLKHVDLERENPKEWKKLFRNRTAEEIFESKTSYGCTDTATLFLSMAREAGIPAKFIEGKRLGKPGSHSWAQVLVEGEWADVDPTQGIKGMEFKPEESKHGPYKVISESLGPSDSMITSYKDWRKIEKAWDYKKNTFKKEIK